MTIISFANSMEPPGTVLIIEGKDVEAWISFENEEYQGRKFEYPFETQYWFENYGIYNIGDDVKIVILEDSQLTTFPVKQGKTYRNTYTYNVKTGSLEEGKSFKRSLILVGLRVVLTLIIEGIVFYVFGFRKAKSWIIFLIINMITQLGLNIYINNIEIAVAYPIILIFIAEFWIFLVETISIPIFVKEHSKKRKIGYALLSNLISLIVGGYILTILPI
jgi:hypothetical protein